MIEHLNPADLHVLGEDPEGYHLIPNWIRPWSPGESVEVGLVGAGCDNGSLAFSGVREGPSAIREACGLFATRSFDFDLDVSVLTARDFGDIAIHQTSLTSTHQRIESAVAGILEASGRPALVVLGGDQSIVVPVLGAVDGVLGADVGLLSLNGRELMAAGTTPAAEAGLDALVASGVLAPARVAQVGLQFGEFRAADDPLNDGLRIGARTCRAEGIEAVLGTILDGWVAQVDRLVASISVDVLDPAFVPGSSSSNSGGLWPSDAFEAAFYLGSERKVAALCIVGVDPAREIKTSHSRFAAILMMSFYAGVCSREKRDSER